MKVFLKKSVLFFAPVILVLLLGEFIVNGGLTNSNYKEIAEWREISEGQINADVIINGSSRAEVHVSPKVLDSMLKVNSYNLGVNGFLFTMEYGCYQFYRSKNEIKPKLIIQILGSSTLNKRDDLFDGYQFYPFYDEKEIVKVASQYNGYLESDRLIPLLRYLKDPLLMKVGFQEFFELNVTSKQKYKGFIAKNISWDGSFEEFVADFPNGKRQEIDTAVVSLFEYYLKESKEEKIPMVLVYAPEYSRYKNYISNYDSIIEMYQGFSDKYGIPLINYNKDSMCSNEKLFYNSQHLNATGAQVFSEKLALQINSIFLFN